MRIPRFVVLRGPPHEPFRQPRLVERRIALPRRDLLDQVEQRPPVAIGHLQKRLARLGLQRQGLAQLALGPLRQSLQIGERQAFQHQHLRAGQHSGVQFETRVLGGGTDQKDRAILHMRQEPILLRLVETVDFVDKQKRPLPLPPPHLGRVENLSQFRHARENRADLHEMQIGLIRQKPRDGGLANAGRPPEDQRRQRARGQHHRQRRIGAKHFFLPNHLGQRARPQPIRQGAVPGLCRWVAVTK